MQPLLSSALLSPRMHEEHIEQVSIFTATLLSAVLWGVPLLAMCVWLSIPLSFSNNLNLELFLLWRGVYHLGTIAFFWSLFRIGLPHAKRIELFLVIICSLSIALVGDWLIAFMPDLFRENYIRATPMFIAPPTVIGLFIVIRRAHHIQQQQQQLQDKQQQTTVDELKYLGNGISVCVHTNVFYYASTKELAYGFVNRLKLGSTVVGCYLTCVYYSRVMDHYAENESQRAIFVLAFPFIIFPWSIAMDIFARKIDVDFKMVENHPKFQFLAVWISYCFSLFFVRDLFINVVEVETVVSVNLTSAVKLIFLFPIRMSTYVFNFQKFVLRKLFNYEDPTTLEDFRLERCLTFYFLCMAERITITTFPLCLAIVHHNFNAPFWENQRGEEYDRLVKFCFITLGIEWSVSTLVTILIMRAFKLNPVLLGGRLIADPQFRLCAVWTVAHICSDFYASTVHTNQLAW